MRIEETHGDRARSEGPRRKLYFGRALVALAFFGGFFALLGSGMPCSFAQLTHQPCPGCGSTRAAWAILRGDFGAALRFNILGPAVAGVAALMCLLVVWHLLVDGTPMRLFESRLGWILPRVVIVLVGLEILLWGLRFCGLFGGPVPV